MIVERIYHHAVHTPQRFALVHNDLPINFLRFARLLARTRRYLQRLPIEPGSAPVAILAPSLLTGWLLVLAMRSLGHTTLYAGSWDAIESLRLPRLAALVADGLPAEDISRITSRAPDLAIFGLPASLHDGASAEDIASLAGVDTFGDHIEYTSGSTGVNKALLRDGRLTGQLVDRAIMEFGLGPESRLGILSTPPWTGVGDKCVLACWSLGACVVFDQRPDWPLHLHRASVDCLFMNPETVKQLAMPSATAPQPRADGTRLRLICGGGFLSPRIARLAKDHLGCDLFLSYAATETGTRLRNRIIDDDDDLIWLRPIPTAELEVVGPDGQAVPDGSEGLVRMKLQAVDPTGYLSDGALSADNYRDGWFYPGDAAIRRADGAVRILGRTADVLNVGGNKIAVEPFEARARDLLGVDGACLFSLQDDSGEVTLLVVIEDTKLPSRERLETYHLAMRGNFSRIEFKAIGAFPLNSSGFVKIDRRAVLALARAG